jgi:predicted N-acetyltransferase YhbS
LESERGGPALEGADGALALLPNSFPVLVLARLTVDQCAQGAKIGAAMLQDAFNRSMSVSQDAGACALLVHALDARAAVL